MSDIETKLIYLASPYSSTDRKLMDQRFDQVCKAVGHLMLQGKMVFSPIAHTHPVAVRCELPRGWEFWQEYDRIMIRKCDELMVLMLPGWEESKGVSAEVAFALEIDLPIIFMEPVE